MKKLLYRIWSGFLNWFGDVKIFRFPMWIVYDPDFFGVDGDKILQVVGMLRPGDVVLRGYQSYLDSRFINGDYSHAGVYVGGNKIVHAISPNVCEINVVDFIECDRVAVCRPVRMAGEGVEKAREFARRKIPYDFGFNSKDVNALYCFELAANCYPELEVKLFDVRKFLGLVRKTVYLADSFKQSKDFDLILEYNPKRGVDFVKES